MATQKSNSLKSTMDGGLFVLCELHVQESHCHSTPVYTTYTQAFMYTKVSLSWVQ